LADPVQDNLLREIQEDLRRERFETLWKRFGSWLIAAAVAVVVAVAAFQGWKAWQTSERNARSAEFIAAEGLVQSNPAAAADAFAALAQESGGYALLARFREAALLADQGRLEDAAAAYEQIAASDAEPLYRDLATLRALGLRLAGDPPAADLETFAGSLESLSGANNPWRYAARELEAALALRQGNTRRAQQLFAELQGDRETPPGIRARAGEMLARLGPPSPADTGTDEPQ